MALIRKINPDDIGDVLRIVVSSGLFREEDAGFLEKMMADYFARYHDEGHVCVIAGEAEALGVAYYEPALATEGTWYLTMIAVNGDQQGRGHGAALMQFMEASLRDEGQRIVLVETSGLPDFAQTRNFYVKCGYNEEARVRDYFTDGEDMVLFRKGL